MNVTPNPPPWSRQTDKELLPEYWERRELLTGGQGGALQLYYTEEQEVYPHDRAYEMGAACQQSPHSYTRCGHYRTCIQCAAEWGQREDQENRVNMTNDLQNFEELTRGYYLSAAHVHPTDYAPTGP